MWRCETFGHSLHAGSCPDERAVPQSAPSGGRARARVKRAMKGVERQHVSTFSLLALVFVQFLSSFKPDDSLGPVRAASAFRTWNRCGNFSLHVSLKN